MVKPQIYQGKFTRYEIARIIGARALQIAMDAPLLLKLSDAELKEMNYDAISLAERELSEGVLPIAVHRPMPIKRGEKLVAERADTHSDEELIAKAQEEEKEITEEVAEIGLVNEAEIEDDTEESSPSEEQ